MHSYGAVVEGRKMYDLELVREEGSGGLLLFKGTESLLPPTAADADAAGGGGGGDDDELEGALEDGSSGDRQGPWSALGLSLTDTSRLLFRTCAKGEGLRAASTYAVLGNKHLRGGEWVHVACDISKVRGTGLDGKELGGLDGVV